MNYCVFRAHSKKVEVSVCNAAFVVYQSMVDVEIQTFRQHFLFRVQLFRYQCVVNDNYEIFRCYFYFCYCVLVCRSRLNCIELVVFLRRCLPLACDFLTT